MTTATPGFRAFLPNGMMEEFGCTTDSLQFYPQPVGANTGLAYIANWLLDLITDPKGNQAHVTYQADVATGAAGVSYPRDAGMGPAGCDSPARHSDQAALTAAPAAPQSR